MSVCILERLYFIFVSINYTVTTQTFIKYIFILGHKFSTDITVLKTTSMAPGETACGWLKVCTWRVLSYCGRPTEKFNM